MSQTNNPMGNQQTTQPAFDEQGAPTQAPVQPGAQPSPGQAPAQHAPQAAPQQTAAGQMAAPQQTPSGQQVPVAGQSVAGQDVVGHGAPDPTNPQQIKDPEEWTTGDQPMTDAQRSYLDSLAKQAGETLPANLTKAQASEHIDRLQQATGTNTGQAPQTGGTIGA